MLESSSAEDWIIDVNDECTCVVNVSVGWNMPGQTGSEKVGEVHCRDLKNFLEIHLPPHIYCRKVEFRPNMGGFYFRITFVKDRNRVQYENRS